MTEKRNARCRVSGGSTVRARFAAGLGGGVDGMVRGCGGGWQTASVPSGREEGKMVERTKLRGTSDPHTLKVNLLRGAPSRCCLCRSSSACGLVPTSNGVRTCAVPAGSQSFGDSTSETDIVWTNVRSCFGHDIKLTKFRHELYGAPSATDGTRITIY